MTEPVESADHTLKTQPGYGAGSVAAGAMLKKAREQAGLHIGALAVALKVPVSKLEALESGHLEQLSGPVFVRALAASVCRSLKIDTAPILDQLPQATTARLHQKGDLNEPFRGDGRSVSFSGTERLLKPSMLAVVALLIGAAVLMFLPNLRPLLSGALDSNEPVPDPVPPPSVLASPVVPESVPPNVPASSAAPSEVTQAVPLPVTQNPLKAQTPLSAAGPASVAAAGLSGGTTVTAGSVGQGMATGAAAGGSDLLSFRALASSWVEVTDAKGIVVLRKTLEAGEIVQAVGVPPLKAIVGRADVTEVTARGKRLELKALSKDNVARFEVK